VDGAAVVAGQPASIARALSAIERGEPEASALLEELRPRFGKACRIVVTGPSGAGKSSLLRGIFQLLLRRGERVAVLACDPASPYTRGAFLGDRLRWADVAGEPGLFIRSVACRESAAAVAIEPLADLLDAAGFGWVFIETAGAGQADVSFAAGEALRLIVLSPASGDEVQMLKAGLLESGDLYAVNKVDLPGGSAWAKQLEEILGLGGADGPRVLATAATTGEGLEELLEALEERAAPRAGTRRSTSKDSGS
jgi:LAO/AO transport system kinase